jgi:iron complex outermembrane recepter protein
MHEWIASASGSVEQTGSPDVPAEHDGSEAAAKLAEPAESARSPGLSALEQIARALRSFFGVCLRAISRSRVLPDMTPPTGTHHCRMLGIPLFALAVATTGVDAAEKKMFDIPAGTADKTLKLFRDQSGRQVLYPADIVRGVKTPAVKGEMTALEAIQRLLADGVLRVQLQGRETTFIISRAPNEERAAASASQEPESELSTSVAPRKTLNRAAAWFAVALSALVPAKGGSQVDSMDQQRQTATVSGRVLAADTGNVLQGAVVSIPAINRQETTDSAGRFTLQQLPEGEVEIIVTYTGMSGERRRVTLSPGVQSVSIELQPADIITLEKFTVSTEREGNALAVTNQRDALNVKNVMAMDSFGNMPTSGVGEVLMRLPGVAPFFDPQGRVNGVSVRGMPTDMTSTTIDGIPALRGQGTRSTDYIGLTGGFFEQIELIKGHTPDQTANSLGGSVNLKTASPLNMREKRRFSYTFIGKWAPRFLEHWSERTRHPVHPLINLGYQEAFDVLGGTRNFGVSVGLYYVENANPGNREEYFYNAASGYIYDYRSISNYVNKHIGTATVRLEYRPSPGDKLELGLLYNKEDTPVAATAQARAFTSQSLAAIGPDGRPTGNGTVLPGFSETQTDVRGLPASIFEMQNAVLSFYARTPSLSFSGEHRRRTWEIDYKIGRTDSYVDVGHGKNGSRGRRGEGGSLTLQARGIGWGLDRSDPTSPRFVQTEGGSIYDLSSYNGLIRQTNRDTVQHNHVLTAGVNVARRLEERFGTVVKTGLFFEERANDVVARNPRQWDRVPGAPVLPGNSMFVTSFDERYPVRLPAVDPRVTNLELEDARLWREDLYYTESQRLSQTKNATERVNAGYLLGRGRIGRLHVLAGTRVERTEFIGKGNVRRATATAAQIPDPVARARHDWGNPINSRGTYTRSFPSAHFTYDFTPELKARASWSTSFGRPAMSALVPNATINETAQTVTMSNPALGPQYAKNADLSLEYYFRPAGFVRAGLFQKRIKDYILTANVGYVGGGVDNGFGGDYSGWQLLSPTNSGMAEVTGWELDYRQQFVFLPGLLKGLELAANYTSIRATGDFGGPETRSTSEVPGFVPRTANISLGYTFWRLGTRINYTAVSDYLQTFNNNPALRLHAKRRDLVMWSVFYKIRPNMTLSADMTNVFAERRTVFQGSPGRTRQIFTPNQTISVGLRGRF